MPHSHDHSGHAGNNENKSSGGNWLSSRTGIIVIVALSILGLLIYTGNGQQLLGYWPVLLIGFCLLSHVFMHGGHGGHRHGGKEEDAPRTPEAQQQPAKVPQAANAPQSASTQKTEQKKEHKHSHGGC